LTDQQPVSRQRRRPPLPHSPALRGNRYCNFAGTRPTAWWSRCSRTSP